jgi:hypothetical protein
LGQLLGALLLHLRKRLVQTFSTRIGE